jgi:hypothetical protein
MGNRVTINREVSVTALYFRNNGNMKSFPKRMEYEGHEYTFVESGLRYLVQKGQQLVQIFDMTDGIANYRLKFDSRNHLWTLIDITESPRVFA